MPSLPTREASQQLPSPPLPDGQQLSCWAPGEDPLHSVVQVTGALQRPASPSPGPPCSSHLGAQVPSDPVH